LFSKEFEVKLRGAVGATGAPYIHLLVVRNGELPREYISLSSERSISSSKVVISGHAYACTLIRLPPLRLEQTLPPVQTQGLDAGTLARELHVSYPAAAQIPVAVGIARYSSTVDG
jgi:hypothetical protein